MVRLRPLLVGILLLALFLSEILGAFADSQTIDEGTHLASGLTYWTTGEVRLNPEHPPLIKLLASAPLLVLRLDAPYRHPSWRSGDQWEFARQFLYHTTFEAKTLLFLGRLPIILLTVSLAFFVWRATSRWFGGRAGLFSLAFFVLDPTVRAHGRLITTDVGLALFFFLAVLTWADFLHNPTKRRFLLFSVCFAAAQLTKFSALILWPTIAFLGLLALLHPIAESIRPRLTFRRLTVALGLLVLTVGLASWAVYGFSFRPATNLPAVQAFYESEAARQNGEATSNALLDIPFWERALRTDREPGRTIAQLARIVPVPALPYFQGAVDLGLHNYYGHRTYLLGETSVLGWWHYFPVAFFVKAPATVVILIGLTLTAAFVGWWQRQRGVRPGQQPARRSVPLSWLGYARARWGAIPFRGLAVALPPLIYVLASLTSHINLGVRHLLPIFPFLYLGFGYLFRHPTFRSRLGASVLSGFLVSAALVAWLSFPNELSYFSEFVGGARFGPRYLLDSNLDWSQGFNALKDYLDRERPDRVYGAFFTSIDLQAFGIRAAPIPTTDEVQRYGVRDGTYAISAGLLFDPEMPYGWLRQYQPVHRLRDSIYVYTFSS